MTLQKLDTLRCTVLDASYDPRSIGSARRGLALVLKGKAHMIEEWPNESINSGHDIFPIPKQVVLHYTIKGRPMFRKPAQLTQKNLFTRDKYTCQYCGRHKSDLREGEQLTRDHVHPQDKGGPDAWTNVVTACSRCNNKKANYFLSDLGMTLKREPYTPTIFELWSKSSTKKR